jgi:hypothetical protein
VAHALSYEEALLWLNDRSGQRMGVWLLRGDVDRDYEIVLTADIGDLQHHAQFLPLPGPMSSDLADRQAGSYEIGAVRFLARGDHHFSLREVPELVSGLAIELDGDVFLLVFEPPDNV